jgi:hypothetical protein
VYLAAGYVSLCASTGIATGGEAILEAYADGLRPWSVADYTAETRTTMRVFAYGRSTPFVSQWHVRRVSTVQRREDRWIVNLRDEIEQDGSRHVERFGFALLDQLVWYSEGDESALRVGIGADNGRSKSWSVGARGATAVFEGILPSNGVHLFQLVDRLGPLSVVDDPDSGNYRTRATGNGLSLALWTDSDAGQLPRRLEVMVGSVPECAALVPSPAGSRATVGASIVRYDITVNDVVVDAVQGRPLMTRASVTERWLYDNGVFVLYCHDAWRRDIDLDPPPLDGQRIGLDIPEGTLFYADNHAGPLYRWQDGRPALTIDARLSSLVQSTVEGIVESLAARGRVDRVEFGTLEGGAPVSSLGHQPYCGILGLYAAARLLGRNLDLLSLVDPSYLTSPDGSSIQDLLHAASAHGLHARAVKNLKPESLFAAGRPVILLVKQEPASRRFDHFSVFCPTPDNTGAVIDLPRGVYPFGAYDLPGLWDGVGVIISDRAIPLTLGAPASFHLRWSRRAALAGALLIAAVFGRRWWVGRRGTIGAETPGEAP